MNKNEVQAEARLFCDLDFETILIYYSFQKFNVKNRFQKPFVQWQKVFVVLQLQLDYN